MEKANASAGLPEAYNLSDGSKSVVKDSPSDKVYGVECRPVIFLYVIIITAYTWDFYHGAVDDRHQPKLWKHYPFITPL